MGSQSIAHEAEHSPEYTAFSTGALLTGIMCEYRLQMEANAVKMHLHGFYSVVRTNSKLDYSNS